MTFTRRNFFTFSGSVAALSLFNRAEAMPVEPPTRYDGDFDIVIVGGGGAGLSAACAASELGASVLVLEKRPFLGGSSLITDAMFAVGGTKLQKSRNIKDSPELYAKDLYEVGKHFNQKGLPEALAYAALRQYEWMESVLNVHPFTLEHQGGQSVPRSHQFKAPEVIEAMTKFARNHGVKILTGIPASRLYWDEKEKRICGVKGVNAKKEILSFHAKRGVIVTSGGFARNPQVLQRFAPYLKDVQVLSGTGSLGEGMLMAQAYGADVRDTSFLAATFGAKKGMTDISELSFIQFNGGVVVNKEGKRFVDESKTYMEISEQAVKQPEGKAYTVFDNDIVREAVKDTPALSRMWLTIPEGKIPDYVYSGNTIEEAAKKAGLDGIELEKTIEKYNKDVANGVDTEFGRQHLEGKTGKLVKIDKAPFFIFPTSSVIFGTYCGLLINANTQVIDVFGDVIPGLYAAGEVTGGLHGAGYMSGSGYAKALSFGRVAGQTAFKAN